VGNEGGNYGTLIALLIVIGVSVWLGTQAHKVVERGSFLKGYFLGNRGLGAWALALTATVQSGGTFMGFPSLVYSYGWIVALWIAGYMVVPITGFAILGKRFAQLSRRTGAITVPDMFRARFNSPTIGLLASLLIMFFVMVTMIAQFKAGGIIMKLAWPGSGALAISEDLPEFRLEATALSNLERKVSPQSVRKLKPIVNEGFPSERALRARLAKLLSDVELRIHGPAILAAAKTTDWLFYLGLTIFSLTVVGYTLIGGFLASVWTDLFQSVLMAIGVVLLFLLVVPMGSPEAMSAPTLDAVSKLESRGEEPAADFVFGPGYGRDYLPIGLAFSFFFVWIFGGLGSPAGMVRVMACKDTDTMRRSIVLLSFYNLLIYLPLVVICICARSIFPDLTNTDEIVPRLAIYSTKGWTGGSLVSGLILSAPFGAVMASVSSFLVLIASGMVRDVYQRFLRPRASESEIRRASHMAMILLGLIAFAANLQPVKYLQSLIVLSSATTAASFVMPALMTAFWRRASAAGAIAAMLAGACTSLLLYVIGWFRPDPMVGEAGQFLPYYLSGIHPIVWGMAASVLTGILVSLLTQPPPETLVSKLFDADPA